MVRRVEVPRIFNGERTVDAPLVTLTMSRLLVDGRELALPATAEAASPEEPIVGLETAMRRKRELMATIFPDRPFSPHVMLEIHREVPAWLVKRVVASVAAAGFVELDFIGVQM
jgi:hypothetical protein